MSCTAVCLILLALCLIASARAALEVSEAETARHDATTVYDPALYPFVARILDASRTPLPCTGALISSRHVLTTRTCTQRAGFVAFYHNRRSLSTAEQGGILFRIESLSTERESNMTVIRLGRKIFDGGKPLIPVAYNRDPAVPAAATSLEVVGYTDRVSPEVRRSTLCAPNQKSDPGTSRTETPAAHRCPSYHAAMPRQQRAEHVH